MWTFGGFQVLCRLRDHFATTVAHLLPIYIIDVALPILLIKSADITART